MKEIIQTTDDQKMIFIENGGIQVAKYKTETAIEPFPQSFQDSQKFQSDTADR